MNLHELVQEYLQETKNPVQLVKHFDEVPTSKIKYPIWGQVKYDGIYTLVVVINGEVRLYSRTGKPMYFETSALDIRLAELRQGVYVAELCNSDFTLEQLAGLVNTNRKAPWSTPELISMGCSATFKFHDYLTVDELLGGSSDRTWYERHGTLLDCLGDVNLSYCIISRRVLSNHKELQAYYARNVQCGHEGVVLKQDCDWVAGHKGYRAMKLVKGISLDLRCVGVVYGKGKRTGQIAALVMQLGEGTFNADLGKGWTDERRKALTLAHETAEPRHVLGFDPLGDGAVASLITGAVEYPPVGKIWEVKALQMSSTGKAMRLPKVQRIRDDKDEPDTL